MVDFERLAVAVVTWNRPAQLQALADAWARTSPAYRAMYVVVNRPDGADGFLPPEGGKCRVVHSGRPPEHHGCMAKSWNLAMLWAFRDPEVEWLLCSMDDVGVLPGWPATLEAYSADLYLAPAGDAAFLFNREVLRRVGWFDERFPVIGFQEWDWQARVIRALGKERVSIEDKHGWRHNPVGLEGFWVHKGGPGDRQRDGKFQDVNKAWLERKWARGVNEMVGMLASGIIAEPVEPEVEWYPWFCRGPA